MLLLFRRVQWIRHLARRQEARIPGTPRQVIRIPSMPILASDAFPLFIGDLNLARQKVAVQSELRQLQFDALAGDTVKEQIVRGQTIEKGVHTVRATQQMDHLAVKVFQIQIVFAIL